MSRPQSAQRAFVQSNPIKSGREDERWKKYSGGSVFSSPQTPARSKAELFADEPDQQYEANSRLLMIAFVFLSLGYMLPWTALGSLISYYKAKYGAHFYVKIYCAYYLPGLPISIFQYFCDEGMDARYGSQVAFLLRGVICYSALAIIVYSLLWTTAEPNLIASYAFLGICTWYLHGTASMMAAMYPNVFIAYLQIGFRCPEIYAVIMDYSLQLNESATTASLSILCKCSTIVVLLALACWILANGHSLSTLYFREKDNYFTKKTLQGDGNGSMMNLSAADNNMDAVSANSYIDINDGDEENSSSSRLLTAAAAPTTVGTTTTGLLTPTRPGEFDYHHIRGESGGSYEADREDQEEDVNAFLLPSSLRQQQQHTNNSYQANGSSGSAHSTHSSHSRSGINSRLFPDTQQASSSSSAAAATAGGEDINAKKGICQRITYYCCILPADTVAIRMHKMMSYVMASDKQQSQQRQNDSAAFRQVCSLCLTLLITMWSSIFQASFFAYVDSNNRTNIEQILYFTRLFSDLLGRPLTFLPRPDFINTPEKLLQAAIIRAFLLSIFFIYTFVPGIPRSDWFIIIYVGLYSVASGYISVLCYEYTAMAEQSRAQRAHATNILNMSFQLAAFVAVVMSVFVTSGFWYS